MCYNLMVVDPDTGEIIDEIDKGNYLRTKEERERRAKYFQHRSNVKKSYSSKRFFFYLHHDGCPFEKLTPQTAARLVYLATYLKYDSNALYVRGRKMTNTSMQKALGLAHASFFDFLKEATNSGILYREQDEWKLNEQTFRKGSIRGAKYELLIKVNSTPIHALYKTTTKKFHKYLGYIFQHASCINTEWNIMCHTPLLSELDDIEPMTVGEFCDAIGQDKTHASRIIKNFHSITFSYNGEQQRFCSFVRDPETDDTLIVVNPTILYTGKNPQEVKALGEFSLDCDLQ